MHSKSQIDEYIEGTLKHLFGIKLKEINFQDNKGDFNQIFYQEEDNEKINHLIYVNDYSSIANYYNTPTIKFLLFQNKAEKRRIKFSVIDECKNYLKEIGDQLIEEKIELKNFENENKDIIKLKDLPKLNLKRVFIDEIGKAQTNILDQPRYCYYSENDGEIFVVDIEAPGDGSDIKCKIKNNDNSYSFIFQGSKVCDVAAIDKKPYIHYNLKNQINILFNFDVNKKYITLLPNDKGKLNYNEKLKHDGIFTFKYKLNKEKKSNHE